MFRGVQLPSAEWRVVEDSLLVRRYLPDNTPPDASSSSQSSVATFGMKIAGFDFDDTLVRKHNDKLAFSSVPARLRELHQQGYTLVLFSNECLDHLKRSESIGRALLKKLGRVDRFLGEMDLPFYVYLATRKDKFRKPATAKTAAAKEAAKAIVGGRAMWDAMMSDVLGWQGNNNNEETETDWEASFFCGDAAGRRGEFSDADLGFAALVGVRFEHARDFFTAADAAPVSDDVATTTPSKRARLAATT